MLPSGLPDRDSVSSRFRDAVRTGNRSELEHLIDLYGLSWARGLDNGYVLLCDAISSNQWEIALLLVTSGCKTENRCRPIIKWDDSNGRNAQIPRQRREYAPLHLAVANGNRELVGMLLGYGADVNVKGSDDETPLHVAVRHGHARITEDLLNYNACVNSQTSEKSNTPLLIVCQGYNNEKFFGPTDNVYENKEEEIAKILIQCGADVNLCNRQGASPIIYAVRNSNFELFTLLLQYGANIGNNPILLNLAVATVNVDIVSALLHHGSNVNPCDSYGKTALHCASLFRCELPISETDCFKSKISENLLCMGANVNAQDKFNSTPLHFATRNNLTETVRILLNFNADVNVKDEDLRTPIHYAVAMGNMEIIKLLLVKGARVNEKCKYEQTPLYWFIGGSLPPKIPYSADHSDSLVDTLFDNFLIISRKQKDEELIISSLLEHGSDVNILNKNFRRALAETDDSHVFSARKLNGVKGLLAKHIVK